MLPDELLLSGELSAGLPFRLQSFAGSLGVHLFLVPLLAAGMNQAPRHFFVREVVMVRPTEVKAVLTLHLPRDLASPPPKPVAPAAARVARGVAPERKPVVLLQPPTMKTQVMQLSDMELPTVTMVAPAPPAPERRVFDVGSLNRRAQMPQIPEPGPLPEPPTVAAKSVVGIRPRLADATLDPQLPVMAAPASMQTIAATENKSGPVGAGGAVVENPANLVMSSARPVPAQPTVRVPEAISFPVAENGGQGSGRSVDSSSPKTALPGAEGGKEPQGNGAKSGSEGASVTPASALPEAMPSIRIIHPSTGRHDVTITASGVDQIIPEAKGILEGDPVQTVYIKVGWDREWTLHYCVPRQGPSPPKQIGGVVSLGAPPVLRAPYPNETHVPPQPPRPQAPAGGGLVPNGGRRKPLALVYGYLETAGNFTEMKVRGSDESGIGAKIVRDMVHWEMRPAVLDGAPVRVQVLFVIPQP